MSFLKLGKVYACTRDRLHRVAQRPRYQTHYLPSLREFDGDVLCARLLEEWHDFASFEHALNRAGPWIAGIDFPFGQARRFVETIGWPLNWAAYVQYAHTLGRSGYRQALDSYRMGRAEGDKEHRRRTDIAAGSISPQKLYGVPVGLMFFEGAPRLVAGVCMSRTCWTETRRRIVVEAYPGVLARGLIGRRSYKNDSARKQSDDHLKARHDLFSKVIGGALPPGFGFQVHAESALCDDPGPGTISMHCYAPFRPLGHGACAPQDLAHQAISIHLKAGSQSPHLYAGCHSPNTRTTPSSRRHSVAVSA